MPGCTELLEWYIVTTKFELENLLDSKPEEDLKDLQSNEACIGNVALSLNKHALHKSNT